MESPGPIWTPPPVTMHPETAFTMWTPPLQLLPVCQLLQQQSLTNPNFDWKSRALYYADKCEQLGTELGNVRHHLDASCATVQSLLGDKREDIDPLIVSVTLESHWSESPSWPCFSLVQAPPLTCFSSLFPCRQRKYVKAVAERILLSQELDKVKACNATLSQELEKTRTYLNSLEQSFGVVRAEHEILTLRLADYVREAQALEDQANHISDIWTVEPPSSPTHLMPIPDGWDDMADIWTVSPSTGLPVHIMPIPNATTCEVQLPPNDQALHLDTVLSNMGYSCKSRDVTHIMACFCRAYMKQHGHGPIPKFFYAAGDHPSDKSRKSKRLTLLSASDLPMLTSVIRNHGFKRAGGK